MLSRTAMNDLLFCRRRCPPRRRQTVNDFCRAALVQEGGQDKLCF